MPFLTADGSTNTGLGWLHAVISYDGEQLSTDNDHAYVLVGSYDPQDSSAR